MVPLLLLYFKTEGREGKVGNGGERNERQGTEGAGKTSPKEISSYGLGQWRDRMSSAWTALSSCCSWHHNVNWQCWRGRACSLSLDPHPHHRHRLTLEAIDAARESAGQRRPCSISNLNARSVSILPDIAVPCRRRRRSQLSFQSTITGTETEI